MGNSAIPRFMENKGVQELLQDKSTKFDLVIVETLSNDVLFGFGEHFNAPVIAVHSLVANRIINSVVGNDENPAYVPNISLGFTPKMTLGQRIINSLAAVVDWFVIETISIPKQEKMYKKYFSNNKKSLRQVIKEDISLAFINTHFSLSYPKSNVPNLIEVGGLHIQRHNLSELPEDMKEFLDSAKNGVILFTMGTFLEASDFSLDQRKEIIRALGQLKERVIWRYNLPDADQLPKNILARKWLPQNEILAHPNLKLFITHGGMLGTTESIYHGKPMIGIPVWADQPLNIARAVNQGYAVRVDREDLSADKLTEAIREILSQPSYRKQAEKLSSIYRDQPMSPDESVLYWTEYVLRHSAAKHLRVEALNLGFFAYHGLDVLLVGFLFLLVPVYLLFSWLRKTVTRNNGRDKKPKLQ